MGVYKHMFAWQSTFKLLGLFGQNRTQKQAERRLLDATVAALLLKVQTVNNVRDQLLRPLERNDGAVQRVSISGPCNWDFISLKKSPIYKY